MTPTVNRPSTGVTPTISFPGYYGPPTGTTNLVGTKRWSDNGNAYNTRPSSITVHLYADGVLQNIKPTWTVVDGSTWEYTFSNLPTENSQGKKVTYTVGEDPVPGYATRINGTTITNIVIPQSPNEYVNISGNKTWADNANEEGTRPSHIVVHLLRDGEDIDTRNVTAGTGWSYSFEHQPADDGYGHKYEYTIREESVMGYYARPSGYNLTNSLLPPEYRNSYYASPGSSTFGKYTEENLEGLVDLFDYDTPLWGGLLGTGEKTPIYPFVFGGIGVALVLFLVLTGKKKKKEEGS